ncbi:MAG: hypothetical protein M3P93_03790, partial [Actinomycetota bacterium]|nr:hypothetical protein [Actinomycetota bacterium]
MNLSPREEWRPLVGREAELGRFRELLYPQGKDTPHLLAAHGLPGIGRRSLLERAVFDSLDLALGPYFHIDAAQRLEDFYLFLLDETSDLETRRRMADELEGFRALDQQQKVKETLHRLDVLCEGRTIPCLVDSGGLLEADGTYIEPWRSVVADFVLAPVFQQAAADGLMLLCDVALAVGLLVVG